MTSIDPAGGTDTATILARMQAIGSAVSSLGPNLQAAAPTGGFAAVLARVNDEITGSASGSSGTSSGAFVSSSSLLGLGGGSSVTGQQVVSDAERYLGVPYQWGGTSASTGFDCSGLVQHVYGDLGISLPRTSQEQATVGTPVASLSQAQPGDLVFFEPGPSGPGHVGIYIGNGEMIDAPHTGTDVQIQAVGQPCAIRRILPTGASASAGGSSGTALAALGVPSGLVGTFESAAAQYGVPAALLAAVAKQESGFDPNAVSSAGAEGLMQLMPSTAAGLGVDPFDPTQAVDGAAKMLSGLISQYNGSVPLALAAYNAGPGAVSEYGGIPPYPQTQAYVSDIMAMLGGAA